MNKTPAISVIVPCYNASETITRCLQSLCQQTYRNLQIIVVDDCSADRSRAVVQQFAEQDDRITLLANSTNLGVADTKNIGLQNATGAFVGFLDSDDWLAPDFLENLLTQALELDVDFVRCDHTRVTGTVETVSKAPQGARNIRLNPRDSVGPARRKTMIDYPYAGAGLIRKRLLDSQGILFQEGLRSAEDRLFFLRLFCEAESYCVSSEAGYFYRKDIESSLTTNGNESQLDVFKALHAMSDYVSERKESTEIREKVLEMSLALTTFHYSSRKRLQETVRKKLFTEIVKFLRASDPALLATVTGRWSLKKKLRLKTLSLHATIRDRLAPKP
ncbi:glycosyltransferase family 2 protein [Sneathiella chinensis]|uniref:Glycosyl transferase n=1 Tax=Sneathiella chinensis TaxID=349750 RepID=A0ABQ5U3C0_9PROT|nr:glycosyltransferase family A protein [Sneathiella chinensis]GLQ05769.1 glycosyl transferase [Sneathiella chinensis]